ncbi:hypothetical protein DFH94DRAFT_683439 [Russula ochroleuca]|uniref:Uncharacterized protein n=1 Tax=Russula ochroleuca TaxID=152965 RepID=A0A9P5T739_9AGAM|nr:hypothetical protein DFH94DRAFT_683439 [Russula ochroleuca]
MRVTSSSRRRNSRFVAMGLMVLGMYEVFLSETRALALPNEVELDTPFDFYCGTGVDQKDLQIAIRHNVLEVALEEGFLEKHGAEALRCTSQHCSQAGCAIHARRDVPVIGGRRRWLTYDTVAVIQKLLAAGEERKREAIEVRSHIYETVDDFWKQKARDSSHFFARDNLLSDSVRLVRDGSPNLLLRTRSSKQEAEKETKNVETGRYMRRHRNLV